MDGMGPSPSLLQSGWGRPLPPLSFSVVGWVLSPSSPCVSCGLPLTELFVLEPGYYEDGAFGIRIENVVLVVPMKTKVGVHLFA